MPGRGLRRVEGRAAPVAAFLSPVAREYPSRALSGVFQAAAPRRGRSLVIPRSPMPPTRRPLWTCCFVHGDGHGRSPGVHTPLSPAPARGATPVARFAQVLPTMELRGDGEKRPHGPPVCLQPSEPRRGESVPLAASGGRESRREDGGGASPPPPPPFPPSTGRDGSEGSGPHGPDTPRGPPAARAPPLRGQLRAF